MKIKYIILLSLLILGCKEEFILNSDGFQSIMVVDGVLTNGDKPCYVNLSLSAPVNFAENTPYENCIVTLIESTGSTEILTETEPGKYMSNENGLKGIIGNEYSISIFTPDGKEYYSDFQELKEPIEIDTAYAELIEVLDINYVEGLPGYQFYVSTKESLSRDNFLLWNMVETFEYKIDHDLAFVQTRFGDYIYSNPRYDTLKTCWNTKKVNYIFTGETKSLTIPQINNQPLHFVSTETKKLTNRYSVLIQQYTINKNAYDYWQQIEEQTTNENFLISGQPYNIKGNIENAENEDELIFGYFTVGSISEKRIFVDKPNKPFYYVTCAILTDPEAIADYKKRHTAPYFWVATGFDKFGIVDKTCIDCRSEGGSLREPDFWTK